MIYEFSLAFLVEGSTAGSANSRKQRIQKRKEEEAERSDAAVLLTAMRKQAEESKNADVEQTNELVAGFDETVTKCVYTAMFIIFRSRKKNRLLMQCVV